MPAPQNEIFFKTIGDPVGVTRTPAQMSTAELLDLACEYAKDGAYFSAARCLRAAADELEKRGRELKELLEGGAA